MASFKKFKIGNTSYDVKDANAGYSIDTNGAAIFLKNSDGTIISSISAPSGMDYDIIADEFDTTPIVSGYNQNDVVHATNEWHQNIGWFVSLVDNNTSAPVAGQTSGDWAQLGNGMSPGLSIPGWVNQYGYDIDPNDTNYYRVNLGAGAMISSWNELTQCPDKGNWTSSGGTSYHQYSVGDYCIYNNNLYRCTGATTGQSWDSTKWTQVQIMDEIPSLPSSIVNSVTVNPIYTSGTPIAQISVTDSNGTQGYTLVAPSGASPIILDLDTNSNLNQIENAPPAGDINLVTPITLSNLETAIANGVPCYITTKANHAIRNTLTKYNTLNYEFSYIGWANGSQRPLSVTLNVSGGTASSVRIS